MDEHDLKNELLRLAEPLPTTPRAAQAVLNRVAIKRRRRAAGVSLALAAVATSAAVAVGQFMTDSPVQPADSQHQIQLSTYTSEAGIRFSVTLSYPEDRVLTAPSVQVGGLRANATLWRLDGADHQGEDQDPLTLPARTQVLIEATLKPNCGSVDESADIRFVVPTTLPGGEKVVETYVPGNPEAYNPALRLWCDVGIAVQPGGGTVSSDGKARVALLVNNPTSHEILVDVPALSRGGTTWQEASATVPAGGQVTLTVRGSGVHCGRGEPSVQPWTEGRVLIDGQPFKEPLASGWDC